MTKKEVLAFFKERRDDAELVVRKQSPTDVSFAAEVEDEILFNETIRYEAVKLAFKLLSGEVKPRKKKTTKTK